MYSAVAELTVGFVDGFAVGSARGGRAVGGRVWAVSHSLSLSLLPARHNLQYNPTEEVILWMNTVGPYHNRQEVFLTFWLVFGHVSRISRW